MRGVVFTGNRKLDIMTFDGPVPGPGEVVIEMKASGMCGSDLHFYRAENPNKFVEELGFKSFEERGMDPNTPIIAGHEPCGVIAEVGPGGHYLGCAHTQAHFKQAFWRTDLLDYKPFETWEEEGARDTQTLASARVAQLLQSYQQPALDPALAEALAAYVAAKKASMPDAFM